MSHVLICGDREARARLAPLLLQWGLTVGDLPAGALRRSPPTVRECDAVLAMADEPAVRMLAGAHRPMAWGAGAPVAPLLLLGAAPPPGLPLLGLPWVPLPATGAPSQELRTALSLALVRAAELRDRAGAEVPGQSALHLLGHELRTPLAALKTALECLCSEAGPADVDEAGAALQERMLAIALRNVARLQRAVDRSHEMLNAEPRQAGDAGSVLIVPSAYGRRSVA